MRQLILTYCIILFDPIRYIVVRMCFFARAKCIHIDALQSNVTTSRRNMLSIYNVCVSAKIIIREASFTFQSAHTHYIRYYIRRRLPARQS